MLLIRTLIRDIPKSGLQQFFYLISTILLFESLELGFQRLYLFIGHEVSIRIGNLLHAQQGMILSVQFLNQTEIRCILGQFLFNLSSQIVYLLDALLQDSNHFGKLSVGITQIFGTKRTAGACLCEGDIHIHGKIERRELLVGYPFVQFGIVSGGEFHLGAI